MSTEHKPQNIQASDDLDGLRLLIETAAANSLPDDYEVKVTIGFMRGLFEQYKDLLRERKELWDRRDELERLRAAAVAEYLGLSEQFEAQEKMLRAYVERFGLILPTDEPRAEVSFPASRQDSA